MAPKKKRPRPKKVTCEPEQGERFHAQVDDVFQFNWWEIICFPYMLCGRLWDCCVTMCAGTNQCLIYWMMIQWLVCKITRLTTPDAIIYPYYFYMFCQVFLLTLFFALIWMWFGKTVFIPYIESFFNEFRDLRPVSVQNTTRISFRRYCFRKSEIFDTSLENEAAVTYLSYPTCIPLVPVIIELLMYEII